MTSIRALAEQTLARLARDLHESLHEKKHPLHETHEAYSVVQSCKTQFSDKKSSINNNISLHERRQKNTKKTTPLVQTLHETCTNACTINQPAKNIAVCRADVEQNYPAIISLVDGRQVKLSAVLDCACDDDWSDLLKPVCLETFARCLLDDPRIDIREVLQ